MKERGPERLGSVDHETREHETDDESTDHENLFQLNVRAKLTHRTVQKRTTRKAFGMHVTITPKARPL